jgi:hypothetical protein
VELRSHEAGRHLTNTYMLCAEFLYRVDDRIVEICGRSVVEWVGLSLPRGIPEAVQVPGSILNELL